MREGREGLASKIARMRRHEIVPYADEYAVSDLLEILSQTVSRSIDTR